MNQKTTYELTITEKLQHMPLPDLEDAIWARVKKQLDLDLPTDDGGDDPAPDVPSGSGWMWGSGLFVFVTALVTLFLLVNQPEKKAQSLPVTNPEKNSSAPSATVDQRGDTRQVFPGKRSIPDPVLSPGDSPPLSVIANADSVAGIPTVSLPQADSQQRTTLAQTQLIQTDTAPPKPKQRGVSGITDNDYRIVPARKDSTSP